MLLPKPRVGNQEWHLGQRFLPQSSLGCWKSSQAQAQTTPQIKQSGFLGLESQLVWFILSFPGMGSTGLVPSVKINETDRNRDWVCLKFKSAIWEPGQEGHRQKSSEDTNMGWYQDIWRSRKDMTEVDSTCKPKALGFKPTLFTADWWRSTSRCRGRIEAWLKVWTVPLVSDGTLGNSPLWASVFSSVKWKC